MPVGAQGSSFKLLTKAETVEGTAATGNYQQLPAFAFDLAASQEMQTDQILSAGFGRSAADPYLDVVTVTGSARVPVDLVNTGVWLKLLLGAPSTSGSTDYTHVFEDGATTLPTNTFEKAFPDASIFEQFTGVRGGSLAMDFSPSGTSDMTVTLMGLGGTPSGTTGAGTPTIATGFTRFIKAQGSVSKDASPLALVTGGGFTFSNNLAEVRTIRNDNRLEGMDIGQSTAEGTLTMRMSSVALLTQATAFTPSALAYEYTISATKKLTFSFPRVFFSRPGIAVQGPLGVELPVRWRAAYDATATALMVVTLKNQVATY